MDTYRSVLILLTVFVFSCPLKADAQGATIQAFGSISGTVTDPTNAVVANASVVATNAPTGESHNATTDANGSYQFPSLSPGRYKVRISVPGFLDDIADFVLVSAEKPTRLAHRLQVAGTDDCFVVGDRPLTESTSPDRSKGEIVGSVTDVQTAGIGRASITAYDESTGSKYGVDADLKGQYKLSNLPAGKYSLRFEAQGFRSEMKTNVHVIPARATSLNADLPVGGCPECIEVVSAAQSVPEPTVSLILSPHESCRFGAEVWVTVILDNTTGHDIFLSPKRSCANDLGYSIFVSPATQPQRHKDQLDCANSIEGAQLRVPPGTTVKRDINISKLFDLERVGEYDVLVELPNPPGLPDKGNGCGALVRSNRVSIYITSHH